jgi:hypothetical protein
VLTGPNSIALGLSTNGITNEQGYTRTLPHARVRRKPSMTARPSAYAGHGLSSLCFRASHLGRDALGGQHQERARHKKGIPNGFPLRVAFYMSGKTRPFNV